MQFPISRLYAIIDPDQTGGAEVLSVTETLLSAGVRLIQYRAKRASSGELLAVACEMAARVRRSGGTFIVNDRADVALAAGADGVHVGQDDLPVELARQMMPWGSKLIGCSTHTVEQVRQADRSSADYAAFGPVFATSSKAKPDAVAGLEGLGAARRETRKPLVAIGGITVENAPSVIAAGADCVAVIGDLLHSPDVAARAREFLRVLG